LKANCVRANINSSEFQWKRYLVRVRAKANRCRGATQAYYKIIKLFVYSIKLEIENENAIVGCEKIKLIFHIYALVVRLNFAVGVL
jgi:hypothetical protein